MTGKLTTHVLDTAKGKPAAGIRVQLHRLEGSTRTFLSESLTSPDGRTDTPMLSGENFIEGTYELTFHLGAYFTEGPTFFNKVPIRFEIADPSAHFHVPLLCTPWSYSTYRGS